MGITCLLKAANIVVRLVIPVGLFMLGFMPNDVGAADQLNRTTPSPPNQQKIMLISAVVFKFDFIIDENITINEPRIKSLIHVAHHSKPGGLVKIAYYNPNAENLANRIMQLLTQAKIKVLKLKLLSDVLPTTGNKSDFEVIDANRNNGNDNGTDDVVIPIQRYVLVTFFEGS